VLRSHSNFVSRLIGSFVLQDRISCTHKKHLTTEVRSGQNKAGNAGLAADAFHPEQHCNWQGRGWILAASATAERVFSFVVLTL
jgi:hypothetical protein